MSPMTIYAPMCQKTLPNANFFNIPNVISVWLTLSYTISYVSYASYALYVSKKTLPNRNFFTPPQTLLVYNQHLAL
jgi:hypothetical protein